MKNFSIIFFCLLNINTYANCISFQDSTEKNCDTLYPKNDYYQVKKYLIQIDSNENRSFNEIITRLKNDKHTYFYRGENFNTFDFIVFRLFLSNNILNCNRVEFLTQAFENSSTTNNFYYNSLKCYINKDILGLERLENDSCVANCSFLTSLKLSTEISNYNFSNDSLIFLKEIDSFTNEYRKINSDYDDFKLLLPMLEIFDTWKNRFPNTGINFFYNFLESKDWVVFEYNSFYIYISNLFTKYSPCTSENKIEPMKLQFSTNSFEKDELFISDGILLDKYPTSSKKKKCIRIKK